jgi:hypothetical protein
MRRLGRAVQFLLAALLCLGAAQAAAPAAPPSKVGMARRAFVPAGPMTGGRTRSTRWRR